jgi:predicted metal-dependent hydrolase
MHAVIPDLIEQREAQMGVSVNAYGIKAMKTRWGSCNPRAGRIWLNLYLIHKPRICLEAVLVHEMVHLLEPSHNQRFYALMTQFMPEWKTCQNYLK